MNLVVIAHASDPEALLPMARAHARQWVVEPGRLLLLTDSDSVAALEAALGPHARLERQAPQWVDWDSGWQALVRPFQVEGLWIAPPDAPCPEPALRIDSGYGFGSGHHPTTRLCLERLGDLLPVSAMLDMGTGTGILALFALALGTPRVVAVDTDLEALRIAEHNRAANQLNGLVLTTDPGPEQFPLVVANILAAPLKALAPTLATKIAHRGTLLLSGIRQSETQEIARLYQNLGFGAPQIHPAGDWVALVMVASW